MKMTFYHRIKNGELGQLLSVLDREFDQYTYEWSGDVPPKFKI
jgi:hypothetical protein